MAVCATLRMPTANKHQRRRSGARYNTGRDLTGEVKMGTRLKVLSVFKELHRTRMAVFKDDSKTLTAARLKINEEFRKNKDETSEENIQKMIKMGSDVEAVLRQGVLQMEHMGENTLLLRPRESLLLENVPYCDQPRKRS